MDFNNNLIEINENIKRQTKLCIYFQTECNNRNNSFQVVFSLLTNEPHLQKLKNPKSPVSISCLNNMIVSSTRHRDRRRLITFWYKRWRSESDVKPKANAANDQGLNSTFLVLPGISPEL